MQRKTSFVPGKSSVYFQPPAKKKHNNCFNEANLTSLVIFPFLIHLATLLANAACLCTRNFFSRVSHHLMCRRHWHMSAYARVRKCSRSQFLQEMIRGCEMSRSVAPISSHPGPRSLQRRSCERAERRLAQAPNHISALGRPELARRGFLWTPISPSLHTRRCAPRHSSQSWSGDGFNLKM